MQSLARNGRKNADKKIEIVKIRVGLESIFYIVIFQCFFFNFIFLRAAPIESVRSSPYPDRFPDLVASVCIRDQYTHARNHPENKPDRFGRFRAPRKKSSDRSARFSRLARFFRVARKSRFRIRIRAKTCVRIGMLNPVGLVSARIQNRIDSDDFERLEKIERSIGSMFARFSLDFSSGSKIKIPDPDSHEVLHANRYDQCL